MGWQKCSGIWRSYLVYQIRITPLQPLNIINLVVIFTSPIHNKNHFKW